MITFQEYLDIMKSRGRNLGELRKNQSDFVENQNFAGDIGYRRAYIIDKDNGWHWVDIKFSKHGSTSTSKSGVDCYVQFRPKVHYPVGTYLFIPDEQNTQLNINKDNPLYEGAQKLWMIVDKTDYRQFIRYLVVKCDYFLKWVSQIDGKRRVIACWAACEAANSYTSGIGTGSYTSGLDNLSSSWIPDTHLIYGDAALDKYNIVDTRNLKHQTRLMITTNDLHPKCWMVSKIVEMNPQGVFKLSIKQDEFDIHRDNIKQRVCDYYTNDGNADVQTIMPESPTGESKIIYLTMDGNGYLAESDMISQINVATTYYFAEDKNTSDFESMWKVKFDDESLNKLATLSVVDKYTISLRLSKSSKLYGQSITLSVSDAEGNYYSSIKLEVIK